MRDVNHAIDNLRQLTKLPGLDFDAAGNLTLVFDGETPINLAKVDDKTLEVWSDLGGLGSANDAETLRRLLESNHLGEGTGSARLAVAPGRNSFVLCERIDVEQLSDTQFGERIIGFLKYVTFWNSAEAVRSVASRSTSSPALEIGELVFRG
ncbi:type III secretion system chaperone [Devosia sp. ZB163]|uniref:type III secretion system chaperone n=1 Tax=Devosia sp. ZB163 TaxID=3025938 RepID=UPI002361E795|nr:type III secretion system chaperone [Devosia sp. ZB163]MDC9822997.1 type III secretion system chaperone [Devosia sp. ZB163]